MNQFIFDESRPWLGGAMKNGDEATYFPELWRWLVEDYGVGDVIDVGCGEGYALDFFTGLCGRGNAIGIDGIEPEQYGATGTGRLTFQHDYTTGPFDHPWIVEHVHDLVWCCEFVEHVEERFVPNFLGTFQCADLVLMTHAEPGQAGWHHVNCKPADYWVGVMAAIGYQHDEELTAVTRELAAENKSPYNHYLRSGLAFKRYE